MVRQSLARLGGIPPWKYHQHFTAPMNPTGGAWADPPNWRRNLVYVSGAWVALCGAMWYFTAPLHHAYGVDPPSDPSQYPGNKFSLTHLWMRSENYHYDPFTLPDEKKDYIIKKRLEAAGIQSGFREKNSE